MLATLLPADISMNNMIDAGVTTEYIGNRSTEDPYTCRLQDVLHLHPLCNSFCCAKEAMIVFSPFQLSHIDLLSECLVAGSKLLAVSALS